MHRNNIDLDGIVEYVREYWRFNTRSPSLRDIVIGCKLSSTSVANYALDILHERGLLIFEHDTTARNIVPIEVYKLIRSYYEKH